MSLRGAGIAVSIPADTFVRRASAVLTSFGSVNILPLPGQHMAYWFENGWQDITGAGLQDPPSIAQVASGAFVLAWVEPIGTSNYANIVAQWLDTGGHAMGDAF